MLVQNVGQWDLDAQFRVLGGDELLWLGQGALWLTVPRLAPARRQPYPTLRPQRPSFGPPGSIVGVNVKLSFVGADPAVRIQPFGRLTTGISYFDGNDPAKWRGNVPAWRGARYVGLYPGVDLEVTSDGDRVVRRLLARDPAALAAVHLRVEGSERISVTGSKLRLVTAVGDREVPLFEAAGFDGAPLGGEAAPRVQGLDVFAPFVPSKPAREPARTPHSALTIAYSTYLGGHDYCDEDYCYSDQPGGLVVDAAGSAYVASSGWGGNYPTTAGAFDTTENGERDMRITKFAPDGRTLIYSTFLGGNNQDGGYGNPNIAVDGSGSVYVAGGTFSADFPTTSGAYDTTFGGGFQAGDATVTKLSPEGSSLVYSTFLGGGDDDWTFDMALDSSGAVYLTGYAYSADFPTTAGAFQPTLNGAEDGFVTKVAPDGSALEYSTFLGGSGYNDYPEGLQVDDAGSVIMAGLTASTDYPTTAGALDTTLDGEDDAVITKLTSDGAALVYSTFLGGTVSDAIYDMALAGDGTVYVTGDTWSPDFPTTPGAYDSTYNPGTYDGDAFATQMSSDGSSLLASTYLGGTDLDFGSAIVPLPDGGMYVGGQANSSDFPTTFEAWDRLLNDKGDPTGGYYIADLFIARLGPGARTLAYSTYLGGESVDDNPEMAIDTEGALWLIGETNSEHFPVSPDAGDRHLDQVYDDFVTKLVVKAIATGIVRDNSTGEPLPGATVLADGPERKSATTDDHGRYVLLLNSGSYSMSAVRFGYATKHASIAVGDDGAVVQSFSLPKLPVYPVTGTVTDDLGTPLAGARITFVGTPLSAVTSLDGTYSVPAVPMDRYSVLAGLARCNESVTQSAVVDQPISLDFVLARRVDAYGYSCRLEVDDYVQGDTDIHLEGFQRSTQVALPFAFPFYGQSYTSVNVATSGFVSFVGTDATLAHTPIPDPAAPNAAIYPFWSSACVVGLTATRFLDTGPVRGFVIDWHGVSGLSCAGRAIHFGIVLWENGEISMQYRKMATNGYGRGRAATIGLENEDGTIAFQYEYNERSIHERQFGIRFLPPQQ